MLDLILSHPLRSGVMIAMTIAALSLWRDFADSYTRWADRRRLHLREPSTQCRDGGMKDFESEKQQRALRVVRGGKL
jgi:hypothetical protein